jgi:xanthine dehydrogenase YagS FAD-binding subunit
MQSFDLVRASDAAAAIAAGAQSPTAQQGASVRFLAGGTTLVDLMKLGVERPERVIDINRLGLDGIHKQEDGSLLVGATVRNSDLAHHPLVRAGYAALSQAILAGASTQLRNAATTAGNLLQRTRCMYFRDPASACNKRKPGSGCPAIAGANRMLAILGTSDACIATNPSDMAVAMLAYDAVVHVQGASGTRQIPLADFYVLPGQRPDIETVLVPGDLVTHVTLPPPPAAERSVYLKPRVLRIRPGIGRRRGHAVGRQNRERAFRTGRRRHPAVACPRSRTGARRDSAERSGLPQRRRYLSQGRAAAKTQRFQGRTGEALHRARLQADHVLNYSRQSRWHNRKQRLHISVRRAPASTVR